MKFGNKANQVAAIGQYLIIDWPAAGRHRGSLDLEDRGTNSYLQRLRKSFVRGHRLQFIVGFDQGNRVSLLEERKDRLNGQIVAYDLPSNFERQICLVEGERYAISDPHPLNEHHLCTFG